ncbi:MAG: hypothetical protein LBH51_08575 [Treponema sp.]|nr:hypothetical protein [Treponema sp.]
MKNEESRRGGAFSPPKNTQEAAWSKKSDIRTEEIDHQGEEGAGRAGIEEVY